jgi:hypothetical protein
VTQPSPSPTPSVVTTPTDSSQPVLISRATGVDYSELRDLLAAGNWRQADKKTYQLMMKAAKLGWGSLSLVIQNFPCEDLRTIDQLWVKYSQGKFGFSVQKEIYLSVNGKLYDGSSWTESWTESDWRNYRRYYIMVGWKTGSPEDGERNYKMYDDLTFNLNAPNGHLPALGWLTFGYNFNFGYRGIARVFSRAKTCDL